jgi:hypothetical protein
MWFPKRGHQAEIRPTIERRFYNEKKQAMAITGNAGDNPVANSLYARPDTCGSHSNTKTCRGNYYAYPPDGNTYTHPPDGNAYTYPPYANVYTHTYFHAHANFYTNAKYASMAGVWCGLARDGLRVGRYLCCRA